MRTLASVGFVIAVTCTLAAQGRPPDAPRGSAAISGVVVDAAGVPVRRAQVQASSITGQPPRVTMTDEQGYYALPDVPVGSWMLQASKTAYVTQQYGQPSPFTPVLPIRLEPGQQFTANFVMARGGAIVGRILDDFGDPVANARVSALRVEHTSNGLGLVSTGVGVPSDDTGAYRIYGLPPGDYYVTASASGEAVTMRLATGTSPDQVMVHAVRRDGAPALAPTYYPGTPYLQDAQRVRLGRGEEQPFVSFRLSAVRAVRVAGTALDTRGEPIQGMVNLHSPIDGVVTMSRSVGTDAAGRFEMTNVAPGTYTLNVIGRIVGDNPPEVASTPLTVTGEDVEGLTVVTTRGGSIGGMVDTDGAEWPAAGRLRLVGTPMRSGRGSWTATAQPPVPGRFEMRGLAGPYALRAEGLPGGWGVRAIVYNGADIADAAIDFKGGEHLDVRVVLTNRIASVRGTVRGGDGVVPYASVLLYPDDETKWSAISRYLRTARADAEGQFHLGDLLPYDGYLVVALAYLEQGDQWDPQFLRRMRADATRLSLSDDERRSLDLRVVDR